jgi:hypothetical protein
LLSSPIRKTTLSKRCNLTIRLVSRSDNHPVKMLVKDKHFATPPVASGDLRNIPSERKESPAKAGGEMLRNPHCGRTKFAPTTQSFLQAAALPQR